MKSKIVVPVVVFGIVAIAALSSVNLANAHQAGSQEETLVDRIASKFGLNKNEVEETLHEFRLERDGEYDKTMSEMFEERLEDAVEDGDLTNDQMFAVLEKHEEMEEMHDDLYNLSPEDAREARADMHEEMEEWAEDNDIDMNEFHGRDGVRMHRFDY